MTRVFNSGGAMDDIKTERTVLCDAHATGRPQSDDVSAQVMTERKCAFHASAYLATDALSYGCSSPSGKCSFRFLIDITGDTSSIRSAVRKRTTILPRPG